MALIFAERSVTQMPGDILEDLFYGKINPWEDCPGNIEEFHGLNQKMSQLSAILEERLDKETRSLLDQYLPNRADMETLLSCDSFKTGFRLGIRIMMAVYKEP